MALRAVKDWSNWLSFLPVTKDVITTYAKEFVNAEMTEDDLSELSHEILARLNITKLGHCTKILKHAKSPQSTTSTKVVKSDIRLPSLKMNISPSKFRKFVIDWKIYKTENNILGPKCNTLLYSACDENLQSNIINGLPRFLEESEENLLEYMKNVATQHSNPTVYRLEFQKLEQLNSQSIDQYIDHLRDKAVDCEFICPSRTCNFDYSEFAIRDRFIQGINDKKIQTNILTNIAALPTLYDVLKHAKSIESANLSVTSMNEGSQDMNDETGIYAARMSTYKKSSRTQNRNTPQEGVCTGCGKQDHMDYLSRKEKCPAWGKTCNKCGIRNHFSNVCRNKNNSALALIASSHDLCNVNMLSDLLCLTVTPNYMNSNQHMTFEVKVLPDTGELIYV